MIEERRSHDRRSPWRVGGRRHDDPQPDWLSVSAYARRYGIDRGTVHKWLRASILEIYRVKRLVRVRNLPPDQHRSPSDVCASVETVKPDLTPS